ncbi:MAG: hypothetical protein ACOCRO_06345 [Halanaerobiales bacterium]
MEKKGYERVEVYPGHFEWVRVDEGTGNLNDLFEYNWTSEYVTTGLIQFLPSTAREMGTITIFKPVTGKLNSLSDAYMAVLAGKYSDALTAPDDYILWS